VEVSEAVGTALDELHFSVEAFSEAIVFCEAPHGDDFLTPGVEGIGESEELGEAALTKLADVAQELDDERAALCFRAMLDV